VIFLLSAERIVLRPAAPVNRIADADSCGALGTIVQGIHRQLAMF
jgi:hypothetical protein